MMAVKEMTEKGVVTHLNVKKTELLFCFANWWDGGHSGKLMKVQCYLYIGGDTIF